MLIITSYLAGFLNIIQDYTTRVTMQKISDLHPNNNNNCVKIPDIFCMIFLHTFILCRLLYLHL